MVFIYVFLEVKNKRTYLGENPKNAAFSSTKPQRISIKTFLFMHKYAVARLFANVLDFLG